MRGHQRDPPGRTGNGQDQRAFPGTVFLAATLADGRRHAVATHQDFDPIGRGHPEGATPTHPGKLVVLWATGLGQTAPFVVDGELPNFAAWIIVPSQVWVEGQPVPDHRLRYVGQAPEFAGLYQINVLLPDDTPTGNVEVMIEVDGVPSQPGLTIAVDP